MDEMEYYTVPAKVVKGADHLMALSKQTTPEGKVETSKDWWVLEETIKVYRSMFPRDYLEFVESVARIRQAHRGISKGVAKEAGGAEIRSTLELPQRLYEMIMTMFPAQRFDKEFVYKFANRLPIFSAVDKI
jgi:hypothetical protein